MFGAALWYVESFGCDVPFSEDWNVAQMMSEPDGITFEKLWAPIAEHHMPLPLWIQAMLYRVTGYDFRAPMFFQVLVAGVLAFVLIRAARRARGCPSYADAFFPLVLLNWGHGASFLWGTCLCVLVPVALQMALLLLIARHGTHLTLGGALAAAFCLLLLPFCGANGLAYVPALTLWLGYCGLRKLFSRDRYRLRDGLFMVILALGSVVLLGLYFIGFQRSTVASYSSDLALLATTTLEFITLSLGPAVIPFWPSSGWLMALILGLSGGIVALTVAHEWLSTPAGSRADDQGDNGPSIQPAPPPPCGRGLGLVFFLAASDCLALGMGWGRPEQIFPTPRYATLGAPLVAGLFFIGVLARHRALGHALQMALFFLAVAAVSLNDLNGLQFAKGRQAELEAFREDLLAGLPVHQLVIRHTDHVYPTQKWFPASLRALRDGGVSYFQQLQDDPPFREIPLPVVPSDVHEVGLDHDTWMGSGADSYLVFALRRRTFVYGIRFAHTMTNATGQAAHLRVSWKRADEPGFSDAQTAHEWGFEMTPDGDVTTLWIAQEMDQFRFQPDEQPWNLKLTEIVLLVAADDPTNTPERIAAPPDLVVLPVNGVYGPEETPTGPVRWCQPEGGFYLINPSDHPRAGVLEIACYTLDGKPAHLQIDGPLVTADLEINATNRAWYKLLTVPPGYHQVHFTCDHKHEAPDDTRSLSFLMRKLSLTEQASTGNR